MGAVFGFIKHVVSAMFKGFVITGILAAIVCFGALFVIQRHLAMDITTVFAAVITVLAAFLGSAVALIYHLSHLEDVSNAVRQAHERRQAQRQQTPAR